MRDSATSDGVQGPGGSRPRGTQAKATRQVTVRDFLIFQLKLLLDGGKDLLVFNLSIGAVLLDLLAGKGRQRRLFYGLMEWSERFDLWLNLHGPAAGSGRTADGLFGASAAGSDTLLGQLEMWTRGGDVPRSERDRGPAAGDDVDGGAEDGAAGTEDGGGPKRPKAA